MRRKGRCHAVFVSLGVAIAVAAASPAARADEVCRFAGTTDYSGHVAAVSDVAAVGGTTRVDVRVEFTGKAMLFFPVRYLSQEISSWRGGQLQWVAVNNRYLFGGHIVRQQWDVFVRGADGLEGYRVQGTNLPDFRHKHPGFLRFWNPATFGEDWLAGYRAARPERRPDLDLHGSSGLETRSPFALAFYWVRWMPQTGETVSVVLPGFKKEKRADLTIIRAAPAHDGVQLWRTALRYPALSTTRASVAQAWTSTDGRLLQLAFDVHKGFRTAYGVIRQQGCQGTPVMPAR